MITEATINRFKHNVTTEVVKADLCIGCGVCAGVCPKNILGIRFNGYGEYVAWEQRAGCVSGCTLCLYSCPFWVLQKENADTLGRKLYSAIPAVKHRNEVGFFVAAFAGYSSVLDHRLNGASGGMATWILENMLRLGLVDGVCCVQPKDIRGKLFEFVILKSPEEVKKCSKSCYYPVEASNIIKYVIENPGRYALVGLPCLVKAVRLATLKNPLIAHRIKYVFGLVCGGGKSSFYAEYICALGGGNPETLDRMRYRIKDPSHLPKDYGVSFRCSSNTTAQFENLVYMSEGPGNLWPSRYFTPKVCNFCDDTFAELADATVMDAWLPEYSKDFAGNNILIIRNQEIMDLIDKGIEELELSLKNISIDKVIESQKNLFNFKRNMVNEKQIKGFPYNGKTPPVRASIKPIKLSFLEKQLLRTTWSICINSRKLWGDSGKKMLIFDKKMRYCNMKFKIIHKMQEFINDPKLTCRRMYFKIFLKP
jgi:coenzyme F420 hydrogenase subunit beta